MIKLYRHTKKGDATMDDKHTAAQENTIFESDYGASRQNEINIEAARRAVSRNGINLSAFLLFANIAAFIIYGIALLVLAIAQVLNGVTEQETIMVNIKGLMSQGNNLAVFKGLLNIASTHIVGFAVFCLLTAGTKRRSYKKGGLGVGKFIALIPIALFLMSIGSFIGDSLNSIISSLFDLSIPNSTIEMIENMPLWLAAITTLVCAPIIEEFVFRRVMIGTLGRYGNVFAIIISSVAFGLFHGNLYQFFYAFLVGLVLGYVYVKSGRWWLSVLMHVIANFFGGILPLVIEKAAIRLAELESLANAGESINKLELILTEATVYGYNLLSLILFSLGIALTVMALIKKWHKIENDAEITLPKGSIGRVVFSNTGAIVFLSFCAINFALNFIFL